MHIKTTQLHSEIFQKPLWGQIQHLAIKSKRTCKATQGLIKQNTMKIYEATDYVAHIFNFSHRWRELHTKAASRPAKEPPHHSLDRQTEGLVLVWWTEKFLPISIIKIWRPRQLGHNLVTILTELSQLLFVKNHNTKSRTCGHPYFVLVCTDMHAHSLTQINTWLDKHNKLHSYCANWNEPAKRSLTYRAAGTLNVRNVLIYKCHSLQSSTLLSYNSKNKNHKLYKIYLNI
jgi:hypothetical protein